MSVKENRAKWVAALRSGEYKQGTGYLKDPLVQGYCCLGVLCRVYEKETKQVLPTTEDGFYDVFEETLSEFPQVREWVGLKEDQGEFGVIEGVPATMLTKLNDYREGWDFNKIADLIEFEPYGLFEENVT